MTTGRINQVAPCGPGRRAAGRALPSIDRSEPATSLALYSGRAPQPECLTLGLAVPALSTRPHCDRLPAEAGDPEACRSIFEIDRKPPAGSAASPVSADRARWSSARGALAAEFASSLPIG